MGIYASASRGYGILDISTLLYSLAILLGISRPAVGGQEEMGCLVTARYQFMIMTLIPFQYLSTSSVIKIAPSFTFPPNL